MAIGKATMSDNDYDDTTSDDSTDEKPSDLRKAADEGKKAKAENAQLKRDLAFMKAGINLEDPKMTYFVKGYDGDLAPAAIRQAAIEVGFLQAEAPDPAAQQVAASQQRVQQASTGVAPVYDDQGGIAALEQAYAEGGVVAALEVAKQYGVPVMGSPSGIRP